MDVQVTQPERLVSVLTEAPSPIFLLGAGASLRSGIPLARGVVEKAARWAYAKANGLHPEDFRIQRSDWFKWLRAHSWFVDGDLAGNYHRVVQHLLQPRTQRFEFFRQLLKTGVGPSEGYLKLAELMDRRAVLTVLTTNFDRVLLDAANQIRRPHHITTVQVPDDYVKLSTSPPHPQLVYLHGSVEHYTDKNLLEEVQELDVSLVKKLLPLLRDHPLVVVGYRGGEPSVMEHLLMGCAEDTNYYHHGVYWCAYRYQGVEDLDPLVLRFARAINGNFQVVSIDGFDELVAKLLWPRYQEARPQRLVAVEVPHEAPTLDMQPVDGRSLNDIDLPVARARLVQYCQELDIPVPERPTNEWVVGQLVDRNLAVQEGGTVTPTTAGYLLFASRPQERVPTASVVVRFLGAPAWLRKVLGKEAEAEGGGLGEDVESGMAERMINGTLWSQLSGITDVLALVNRPFRLKGEVSEMVYPYPSLALKEVIVNALVHRHYGSEGPILIEVEPALIRILNPGGLVEDVQRRVEAESIEEEIRRGRRGIKGYRNPVIADLFYGAGNMDKEGSGLADVLRYAVDNGNEVRFGPTEGNAGFVVTIYSRPEAVDEVTGTASPLEVTTTRFVANIVEVLTLPEGVWHAATDAWGAKPVYTATGADWLPPFLTWNKRLFTFSNLEDLSNPLRSAIDKGTVESLSLDEFVALERGEGRGGARSDEAGVDLTGSKTGEDLLVWLMGLHLHRHLSARGLVVDKKRQRAYFPRTASGARPVTYQARLRRATRTVVKPRGSRADGEPSFWEHKSLGFRFERFGDAWGLMLTPGYVFTFDGRKGLLQGDRVNRLTTRRASRDYNSTIHHDLVFWLWVLSGGEADAFPLYVGPSPNPLEVSYPDEDSGSISEGAVESAVAGGVGTACAVIGGQDAVTTWETDREGNADYESGVVMRAALPTVSIHDVVVADDDVLDGDDSEVVEVLGLLEEEAERARGAADVEADDGY